MKKLPYPDHPYHQIQQRPAPPSGSSRHERITPAQATAQANRALTMVLVALLIALCWFNLV